LRSPPCDKQEREVFTVNYTVCSEIGAAAIADAPTIEKFGEIRPINKVVEVDVFG
jgi:hypothetical protein